MKAWCAALATEVSSWSQVHSRAFFGFTALYRGDRIFALLPRSRGMETANALAFKLDSPSGAVRASLERDPRIGHTEMRKARWFTFEISSSGDLRDALDRLSQAYEAIGNRRRSE